MKTIGLIGGTTWVSTTEYYRNINRLMNESQGGVSSAKILLYSLNYAEFQPPQEPDGWGGIAELLSGIAKRLEGAGADCLLICANTPHIVAGEVQSSIKIPLLHIGDATAKEIKSQKIKKIGLLGTRYTMEYPFLKDRLSEYGIETIVPDDKEREFIHASIFNELGKNIFKEETKKKYLEIIDQLESLGAEGVILGCTEIPLLINQSDRKIPMFDTTLIHSKAAVEFAVS